MDFALPEIGEGVYEAELVSWLVQTGQTVQRGQGLLEVMTDKATMEVPSPFVGSIGSLKVQPGDKVKVGQVVLTYGGSESASTVPIRETLTAAEPVSNQGAIRLNGSAKAAPSVRLLARQLGIDLGSVAGSGPNGRILVADLKPRIAATDTSAKSTASRDLRTYGVAGTRVKLQGLRRRIAEHMAHAKRTIPHFSYVDECDVTELVHLRGGLRDTYAAAGMKLTYLPFFIKAVAASLREVPIVNASLDEQAGEIVLHDRYHIGIAVDTPSGLIVPVIRDADQRDIASIARELERVSREAREGRARLDDLKGGTFTVSSVGSIGGLIFTPVINHPEVGILGIGKVTRRPVYDEAGRVSPADLVYLSLSFDHRVIDGAVAAHFCNVLLRKLQHPALLLLPDKL